MSKSTDKPKSCFVICPIGDDGSEIRARSDDIFQNLIKPVTAEFGYAAFRIIDDTRPGEITQQIVEAVMESDLVIADLSGRNPNVFYELALRHMIGQPFIHMVEHTSEIPFDISVLNAITLRFGSIGGVQKTALELKDQIAAIQSGKANFQNPVSRYQERAKLEASGDAEQIAMAELMDDVASLKSMIGTLFKEREAEDSRKLAALRRFDEMASGNKGSLANLARLGSHGFGSQYRGSLSQLLADGLGDTGHDDAKRAMFRKYNPIYDAHYKSNTTSESDQDPDEE